MRLEARAVRRGLTAAAQVEPTGQVEATGYGPSAPRGGPRPPGNARSPPWPSPAPAAVWPLICTPVTSSSAPRSVTAPAPGHAASAPLLAGELRRAGLPVRAGRIISVDHLVHGAERERLAAGGALVADLESAALAQAANGRPLAVLRAVSDTPDRPLLRPGALSGGLAALRSLRAAGPVLARWAAATGQRQILLAGPRSFCAGVERAIEIVERVLEQHGPPVYVRKQIVHNSHVVAGLEAAGSGIR